MPSVDRLGRIVIPATIRHQAGLLPGTPVDFEVLGGSAVMRPVGSACVFCGTPAVAHQHRGKGVCADCLRELRDMGGMRP